MLSGQQTKGRSPSSWTEQHRQKPTKLSYSQLRQKMKAPENQPHTTHHKAERKCDCQPAITAQDVTSIGTVQFWLKDPQPPRKKGGKWRKPGGKLVPGGGQRRKNPSPRNAERPTVTAARISRNNLPRLLTTIKGREIEALIDSGSSDSAVRTTLLTDKQLQEVRPGPLETNLASDGATLQLQGIIDLEVFINSKSYPA